MLPGHEADHSPPFHAHVNAWSYTSTPPYVFISSCLVKYRNNYTFILLFKNGMQRRVGRGTLTTHWVQVHERVWLADFQPLSRFINIAFLILQNILSTKCDALYKGTFILTQQSSGNCNVYRHTHGIQSSTSSPTPEMTLAYTRAASQWQITQRYTSKYLLNS